MPRTSAVKNGFVMSEMMRPSTSVARVRRLRAAPFGRYPSSLTAASTRSRRSAPTSRGDRARRSSHDGHHPPGGSMARVGLLTMSDGRDFVAPDLDAYCRQSEEPTIALLRAAGHEVVRADAVVSSNELATREAR